MTDPRAIVVDALTRAVQLLESRLSEFKGHSARVAGISASVAQQLALHVDEVADVRVAGLLHDIGMLAVPDEYLTRPGRLKPAEYERIKAHPRIGADLVRRLPFLRHPAVCIAFHHERWDGSGYPKGLRGPAIPRGAQIVGIAEVFSSLVEKRPHRDPMSPSEALETLIGAEGVWFSHETVLALAQAVNKSTPSPPRPLQSRRRRIEAP